MWVWALSSKSWSRDIFSQLVPLSSGLPKSKGTVVTSSEPYAHQATPEHMPILEHLRWMLSKNFLDLQVMRWTCPGSHAWINSTTRDKRNMCRSSPRCTRRRLQSAWLTMKREWTTIAEGTKSRTNMTFFRDSKVENRTTEATTLPQSSLRRSSWAHSARIS